MEKLNENENDKTDKIKLIDNLISIKNEYIFNNNLIFSKKDSLFQIDSYINSIKSIYINTNINQIQTFLNSLINLSNYLESNLTIFFEEKNHFYLKYEDFNDTILNKISNLNESKNAIIKIRKKLEDLINNYTINKEIKFSMNINKINSIEECITNPIFIKNINSDVLVNIKNINIIYNNLIKNYSKNKNNLIEINVINKEFINQIKKTNIFCKDMKNKYLCNKYMKNTEDNTAKISNNIYNCYIKLFLDYIMKFSKIAIKKISEENLKLFSISNENSKLKINIKNEDEKNNSIKKNNDNLNLVLNEGFKNAEGKNEYINKKDNNINILNLDEEFGEKKNDINIINKDYKSINFIFEERKKYYQNLFNIKAKLSESNKNNYDIILNLNKIENEFNNKIIERENIKISLNDKFNQIMKNKKEDFLKEKKDLENELNNLKLKEKEYELKFVELKEKYKKEEENIKIIKNNNRKKEKQKIINNNKIKEKENENIKKEKEKGKEKEKEKEKINFEPKKEINIEENIIINNKKNIDKNNKVNKEKKLFQFFNNDMPLKKESLIPKEQNVIKKEKEEQKENLNINNNAIPNKENNIINNNPFSKDKEKEEVKEEDPLLKQVRALDNLSSVRSNRNSSQSKKESFSPTIIKRGINNEKNISMLFSGLNINNNLSNHFSGNKSKGINNNNPFVSNLKTSNIFSQIQNNPINNPINNGGNINGINNNSILNDLNKKTEKTNIFEFKSNSNNPFNTNLTNKQNPFSLNLNNININNEKTEQSGIFKDLNLSNNYTNFSNLTFGMHNSKLTNEINNFGNPSNNNSNNLISISFGNNNNNNIIGNNGNNNNSFSPFTQFNSGQGFNNFANGTQNTNDENYF